MDFHFFGHGKVMEKQCSKRGAPCTSVLLSSSKSRMDVLWYQLTKVQSTWKMANKTERVEEQDRSFAFWCCRSVSFFQTQFILDQILRLWSKTRFLTETESEPESLSSVHNFVCKFALRLSLIFLVEVVHCNCCSSGRDRSSSGGWWSLC